MIRPGARAVASRLEARPRTGQSQNSEAWRRIQHAAAGGTLAGAAGPHHRVPAARVETRPGCRVTTAGYCPLAAAPVVAPARPWQKSRTTREIFENATPGTD